MRETLRLQKAELWQTPGLRHFIYSKRKKPRFLSRLCLPVSLLGRLARSGRLISSLSGRNDFEKARTEL